MRPLRHLWVVALAGVSAAVVVASAPGCATPTALTVAVDSEVPCPARASAVLIGASDVTALAGQSPAATSTSCTPTGSEWAMGQIVVIPAKNRGDSESVAFAVMTRPDGASPAHCLEAAQAPACIVARRELRLLPHTELNMRVDLRLACLGVSCASGQTCVQGACVSDTVDPTTCSTSCGETTLAPDGGAPRDAGADTGTGDATLPSPAVCGDVSGLQAAAPWPMRGYCPTHQGRSPLVGPQTGRLLWRGTAGAPVSGLPTVAADGTIYVGSNDHSLHAYLPDGGSRWAFPVGGNINNPAAAIGADGTLTVPCSDEFIYHLGSDGGFLWKLGTGSDMTSSPVVGADGTLYVGGGYSGSSTVAAKSLLALRPADGGQLFAFTTMGAVETSPAIGLDGTIYFGSDDGKLYAVTQSGALTWSLMLGEMGSPTVGDDGTIYVPGGRGFSAVSNAGVLLWSVALGSATPASVGADGTLYLTAAAGDGGTGVELYALTPSGAVAWSTPVAQRVDYPPAVGADGTIYVASFDGFVRAVSPAGAVLWTYTAPAGGGFNSGIALADHVLYVGGNDNALYALGP